MIKEKGSGRTTAKKNVHMIRVGKRTFQATRRVPWYGSPLGTPLLVELVIGLGYPHLPQDFFCFMFFSPPYPFWPFNVRPLPNDGSSKKGKAMSPAGKSSC